MIQELARLAAACRSASRRIAACDSRQKDQLLDDVCRCLAQSRQAILAANRQDMDHAQEKGLSGAMLDRLKLDEARLQPIIEGVREVRQLPDPVGEVSRAWLRPNGLQVGRVRIPLGVIAMIYEARPNVTIDAAVLCLKAGNGIILRGGSEAFHSNRALARVLSEALDASGLPAAAATLVPTTDRSAIRELLTLDEHIDLVIPRGGEGLIRFVAEHSRIPVIKHYKGVCHLYVDKLADQGMAIDILLDGKTSRPGVCNALETMLVHRDIAAAFLTKAAPALAAKGVLVKGCPATCALVPAAEPAGDGDFGAEFLDLILAVKVVDDMAAAIEHIAAHGSNHTEAIVTESYSDARRFVREVNSSVVLVNASTRFSDGGQLGLGAEIGISTTKLHAYGPMGLQALTTEKFTVFGSGQTRHPVS